MALLGRIAASAEADLREQTAASATFCSLPDPGSDPETASALASADVVVGTGLPDGVPLPETLRLVQHVGAGVDAYDPDRLPDGAWLCNVYGHGRSVAEHVFAVLLSLRRDLCSLDAGLREGRWARTEPHHVGLFPELHGSTLGLVGYGHVGRHLAPRAAAFGMDVVAIRARDPDGPPPDSLSFLGGPDDLDAVLGRSDAVVVAVPLTAATRGLIGGPELSAMGDEAVLVNVARGPVVAEAPLYRALRDGDIAGAGLDVWYDRPDGDEPCRPSGYPFHELDNVVLTPHVAGWSEETWEHRWAVVAANVDRVAAGRDPENVVRAPS